MFRPGVESLDCVSTPSPQTDAGWIPRRGTRPAHRNDHPWRTALFQMRVTNFWNSSAAFGRRCPAPSLEILRFGDMNVLAKGSQSKSRVFNATLMQRTACPTCAKPTPSSRFYPVFSAPGRCRVVASRAAYSRTLSPMRSARKLIESVSSSILLLTEPTAL